MLATIISTALSGSDLALAAIVGAGIVAVSLFAS
jgi:hypothetical protein